MVFRPDDESSYVYTLTARELDALRRAEEGGRFLINRDTDVLNGVWGGNYDGEALVVDYDKDKNYYDGMVEEVIKRATPEGASAIDKRLILDIVKDYAREKMSYSLEKVEEIYQRLGARKGMKVSLAYYAHEGYGVCAHQALLAATILELLRKRGLLRGTARVNRSMQWPQEGEPGGHAWVRYTNSAGDVIIIDPAQNYIGSLSKAAERSHGWNYLLPSDRQRAEGIGATAAHRLIDSADIPK